MEPTQEKTPEQIQLELNSNKIVREHLAWLHYRMQSFQFFLEEAPMAQRARDVLAQMCNELQQRIEAVEPPAPKEEEAPKKPYIIEVPPPQAEQ